MPKPAVPYDLKAGLLSSLATSNRITCYLIENIPADAWFAKPPEGKGRSIAAIAVHIHNVRRMWLKAVGSAAIPEKLEENATAKETLKALGQSQDALASVIAGSLDSGYVKGFKPDAAGFIGYLISHDAHHRGQISSLARRLGHPITQSVMFGMWEWGSRAKEV